MSPARRRTLLPCDLRFVVVIVVVGGGGGCSSILVIIDVISGVFIDLGGGCVSVVNVTRRSCRSICRQIVSALIAAPNKARMLPRVLCIGQHCARLIGGNKLGANLCMRVDRRNMQ